MSSYIDSHVHFWDPERLRYDWLETVPAIHRPFLPPDLQEASEGLDLEALIFVEADCHPDQALDEVRWVSELAQGEPRIQGIVAHAPLEKGERVRGHLLALRDFALVKGVRRLIQSEPLGFARDPDFVWGVKMLPEYGFSFDICVYHRQMGDVLYLVEACPEVSFVLDHVGKPGIRDHLWEPWASQIRELATHPRVYCKLSGMVTEADHAHWTPEDLRPYMDHVLECFGPDRLMFGSDWPVVTLAATYRRWFQVVQDFLASLDPGDRRKVLRDNAVRFYRLDTH